MPFNFATRVFGCSFSQQFCGSSVASMAFFHEPTTEDLSLKPQPKSARSIEFTVQRFQRSRTWAAHCKMQHAFVNRIFNLQIYILPSHPRNLLGIQHGKFPDAKLGRHRLPPKGFLWECSRMCMWDLGEAPSRGTCEIDKPHHRRSPEGFPVGCSKKIERPHCLSPEGYWLACSLKCLFVFGGTSSRWAGEIERQHCPPPEG